MASSSTTSIIASQAQVQERSGGLRRELGLRDLVLAQILYMLIPEFFGTAAKAGSSHVALWILAIVFFFIPLACVVTRLNRLMPLEGGLYEWTRLAFGDRTGFMVAWNLWLYAVIYMAMAGMVATRFVTYTLGSRGEWLLENRLAVVATSIPLIAAIVYLTRVGFVVAKWVTNVGGVVTILALGALVIVPFVRSSGSLPGYNPLRIIAPPLSIFTLSVFSKMTFGALCGFEYIAIFAGECREPERNLARSVVFAAPIIGLLYILGTSAILAFVPVGDVDVTAAIPQALSRGFHSFLVGRFVLPLAVLFLLINYLATFNVNFNGCSRLPMVAGWDQLLPAWFTRLHPKHKTPVNSIFFAGGAALVLSMAVLIGVKEQESFELLLVWAFAFYALAYLGLFAIPLFTRRDLGFKFPLWLRIAAASGLLTTVLYIVLSAFPIIAVQSTWEYSAKTISIIVGANVAGLFLYRAGTRRARVSLGA